MVLWSAQGMSVPRIAGLAFTSEDRVRDVLHNFNATGSSRCIPATRADTRRCSRWPSGGRSRRSPSPGRPSTGCRFPRWSLAKLADFLVAEGVVEDISHEGLRELLRAENISFQAVKTWRASADPDYAGKKALKGVRWAGRASAAVG